jgi:aminopeptidase N
MSSIKRLYSQFKPKTYDLDLKLNTSKLSFTGRVVIKGFRASRPSHRISLHASGLKFSSISLYKVQPDSSLQPIEIVRTVQHKSLDHLRIHTKEELHSGGYQIELDFSTKVDTASMNGVYLSKVDPSDSNSEQIIATQFEPNYARRLFPCIDEPEAKAIFKLSLNLPNDLLQEEDSTVLSNCPELSRSSDTHSPNRTIIQFHPTPLTSPYLLAIVIGKLKSLQLESKNGTLIKVWAEPNKADLLHFSIDFARRCLDFLEDYFGTQYPLKKCDLVAVPDFEVGGMENWGLILFREELLLFDPDLSTLFDKQSIALTIAHELAHQWFGNLVTMRWWDELWLNEGFATFMEFLVVDSLYPEWRILEYQLIAEKDSTLRTDSMPSSRPIVPGNLHHSRNIEDNFDDIAYQKSASFIAMIESFIGPKNFKEGLRQYFKKFKYSNASSKDLIEAWSNVSGLNLTKILNKWIYYPGIPKIATTLEGQTLSLSQSRFISEGINQSQPDDSAKLNQHLKKKQAKFHANLITKSNLKESKEPQNWPIPLGLVYSKNDQIYSEIDIFKTSQKSLTLPKGAELLKLNPKGSGLYIVDYDPGFLKRIKANIANGSLPDLDILNFLSDVIHLNKASQSKLKASDILKIILKNKTSVNPYFWGLTGSYLAFIFRIMDQALPASLGTKLSSNLIKDQLSGLSLVPSEDEDYDKSARRVELLSIAALANQSDVCKSLRALYYEQFKKDLAEIPSEIRSIVLYVVARQPKKGDYSNLLEQYKLSLNDFEINDLLASTLCSFKSTYAIKNNIKLMQDPQLVRAQDIATWITGISTTSITARDLLLDWIIDDGGWQWLLKTLGPQELPNVVSILFITINDLPTLQRISSFLKSSSDFLKIEKAYQEGYSLVESRLKWIDLNKAPILRFLKKL